MVLITHPTEIKNEVSLINEMFERGLPLLHIRKPHFSIEQLEKWIESISIRHLKKLVIHIPKQVINTNLKSYQQYITLINSLNSTYVHLSTENCSHVDNKYLKKTKLSTSVHCITELNELSTLYSRAFIGPVFPSISKIGYATNTNWNDELSKRTNYDIELVALGGIIPERIPLIQKMGFDDFAVLGGIWESNQPLNIFEQCLQYDQLY